jgi:hypothetical protein
MRRRMCWRPFRDRRPGCGANPYLVSIHRLVHHACLEHCRSTGPVEVHPFPNIRFGHARAATYSYSHFARERFDVRQHDGPVRLTRCGLRSQRLHFLVSESIMGASWSGVSTVHYAR